MTRLAHRFMPVLALLAAVGLTTAARAAEEPPVVRALLDSTAITAADRPTYASLDVAADGTITLRDFITTFEADDDPDIAMSYEVGTLVLSGVSEIAAGLFEVETAEWSQVEVTVGGESAAAIPLITAGSLYIRQPAKEPSALDRLRATLEASGLGEVVLQNVGGAGGTSCVRHDPCPKGAVAPRCGALALFSGERHRTGGLRPRSRPIRPVLRRRLRRGARLRVGRRAGRGRFPGGPVRGRYHTAPGRWR